MGVGDTEPFDGAVEGEDVGEVAVVEPETGGGDEDGPVGGVGLEGGGKCGQEGEEGEREEMEELHCGGREVGGWAGFVP